MPATGERAMRQVENGGRFLIFGLSHPEIMPELTNDLLRPSDTNYARFEFYGRYDVRKSAGAANR